jgi:hypothetical protein
MRKKCLRVCTLSLAAGGLVLLSGCQLTVVEARRTPVVQEEPLTVMIPETYVYDGVEYVGFVGERCYYLGPDHVWLVADRERLMRFRGYERVHPDWRTHATRNELYRKPPPKTPGPLKKDNKKKDDKKD